MDIEQVEAVKSGCCRCCGRHIKDSYMFCVGCERKRAKIIGDCVGAGMSIPDARAKAEAAYPQVFE